MKPLVHSAKPRDYICLLLSMGPCALCSYLQSFDLSMTLVEIHGAGSTVVPTSHEQAEDSRNDLRLECKHDLNASMSFTRSISSHPLTHVFSPWKEPTLAEFQSYRPRAIRDQHRLLKRHLDNFFILIRSAGDRVQARVQQMARAESHLLLLPVRST